MKIFGWEHLTFLAVYIAISVVSLVLIKLYVKKERTQDIVVRCVGVLLFAFILWSRIALTIKNKDYTYLIPSSFCGMSSFVLSMATIFGKRNNFVLHFVVHFAVVGCVLTLAYPDFIETSPSIFYSIPFSGLMHHAISLFLCVLLYMIDWFRPSYKKAWSIVSGFTAYITVGAFLIAVCKHSDAFYINKPILAGTPFTIWVIAPVFAVSYAVFIASYELIRIKIQKKKQENIDKKLVKIILDDKF